MAIKIAAIYTSTTKELIDSLNTELNNQLGGRNVEIVSYENAKVLAELREHGYMTSWCARSMLDLYEKAYNDGANILLNVCSSVGDIAYLCKPLYEMLGVKFIRVDEDMAKSAVQKWSRIGIVATLPTTLEPTKRLVQHCADEVNKNVSIVDALAEGAFGLDRDQFVEKLIETGNLIKNQVDVLVFAQGSMAYAQDIVSEALNLPVLSSIRFGSIAVREAVFHMDKL